jgi:hypothetical protein
MSAFAQYVPPMTVLAALGSGLMTGLLFAFSNFVMKALTRFPSEQHGRHAADQRHKYVFQDAYAWAGEFRSVPIAKGNSFFARPEHIRAELQKLFHQLAGEQYLRGSGDLSIGLVGWKAERRFHSGWCGGLAGRVAAVGEWSGLESKNLPARRS